MKTLNIASGVLAGLLLLAQLIRSFYGATGTDLGRAALAVGGIWIILRLP
jgi:hypothetical protein